MPPVDKLRTASPTAPQWYVGLWNSCTPYSLW